MRAARWIGVLALIGAAAVTVFGARAQAVALVADWQNDALSALDELGAVQALVQFDGRTLRVEGRVADATQQQAVLFAMSSIEGVRTVESHLEFPKEQSTPVHEQARFLADPVREQSTPSATSDNLSLRATAAAPPPCQGDLEVFFGEQSIHFAAFSAAVNAESEFLLEDVAEVMAKCPGTVLEISGHSDGQGIEELNDSLSRARADAVRQTLIQRGIAPGRLIAMGFGDRIPVADDTTEQGRMRNRRIELRLREARCTRW